jgi:hypothetical protein
MAKRIIDTSPIPEWAAKHPDQLKRIHEAYGNYPIFKDGQIVGRKEITLEDQMKDRGLKEASVLSYEDSRVIANQMSLLGNQVQKLDDAWDKRKKQGGPASEGIKLRKAYEEKRARLAQAHGALNLSSATYNALDNLNVDKINRLHYGGPWAHRDEPLKPTDTSNFPQDSNMWYDWRTANPFAPARTGPRHGSGISPLGVMGYPLTNPQLTAHAAQQITGSDDFKRNIGPLLTEGVKYKESKVPLSDAGSAGYTTTEAGERPDGTFLQHGAESITLHTHGAMGPHNATIDHEAVHAAQGEAMKGRPIDNLGNMTVFDEPHAAFYDSGVQYGYTDTSAWDPIAKAAADKMFGVGTAYPTVDPKLTRWENARYYGGNLGASIGPNYQNWVEKFAPHAPPLVTQGLPKLPSGGSESIQIGLPEGSNVPTY